MFRVVTTRERSEMAANDIVREGLITPIALIRLREHATSFILNIIFHELKIPGAAFMVFGKPVTVHLSSLTLEQGGRVR